METQTPDHVGMPDSDVIPTKNVSTSTAFGTMTGRDPEEMLAELADARQSEESACVAATEFPAEDTR